MERIYICIGFRETMWFCDFKWLRRFIYTIFKTLFFGDLGKWSGKFYYLCSSRTWHDFFFFFLFPFSGTAREEGKGKWNWGAGLITNTIASKATPFKVIPSMMITIGMSWLGNKSETVTNVKCQLSYENFLSGVVLVLCQITENEING